MNRILRMAVAAIAATILAACSQDLTDETLNFNLGVPAGTVELTLRGSMTGDASRIEAGEPSGTGAYPILWQDDETLTVFEYVDGQLSQTVEATLAELSADRKYATFRVNLARKSGQIFEYYAFYHPSGYRPDCFFLNGYQHPDVDSFSAYTALMLARSGGHTVQGGDMDCRFRHISAYAKMTLTGLKEVLDGSEIMEVRFSADGPLCGNFDLDVRTGAITPHKLGSGTYNTLQLDIYGLDFDGSAPFDVWFTSLPLANIKSFSVEVRTQKGLVYTKQIVLGDARLFSLERGELSCFTVDMSKQEEKEEEDDPSGIYSSRDYSRDKTVRTVQRASKGNGVNIVLMGDGFSDRQIASGTYDNIMNMAASALFDEEPYKSFKDLFNVYVVYAVSKNEGYIAGGSTVFNGYFGDGTLCGGTDTTCFSYAQKVLTSSQMNEALIVVMMNSTNYAGTCWMYYPSSNVDYGSGVSVAYFPIGTSQAALTEVLHHEACGHGFAKLDDEYSYQSQGTIPSNEVAQQKEMQNTYGWYKNVDFTSNTKTIRWSKFIADSRYSKEGLGAYEGASTYWRGVWRPTYNSIMRYNNDGFNAPSREAIYYRIHKLAYGNSWQYSYEDFVSYDAVNRKTTAVQSATVPQIFEPLHRPVLVKKRWQDAMADVE